MKQIKRYDISGYDLDISEWEKGDMCKYEDHIQIVESMEKENEELRKYKEAYDKLKNYINNNATDLRNDPKYKIGMAHILIKTQEIEKELAL